MDNTAIGCNIVMEDKLVIKTQPLNYAGTATTMSLSVTACVAQFMFS